MDILGIEEIIVSKLSAEINELIKEISDMRETLNESVEHEWEYEEGIEDLKSSQKVIREMFAEEKITYPNNLT